MQVGNENYLHFVTREPKGCLRQIEDLKWKKGSTFPWKAQLNCRARYHTVLRKSNYKGLKIN